MTHFHTQLSKVEHSSETMAEVNACLRAAVHHSDHTILALPCLVLVLWV